jgi:hypothetical protein
MKTVISAAALALSVLSVAAPAEAAIRFTVNQVTFGTGGTARGSFVTDDALTTIESFYIATSDGYAGGAPTSGMEWNSERAGFGASIYQGGVVFGHDDIGQLVFEFPKLTASGATMTGGYERIRGKSRPVTTGFGRATLIGEALPTAGVPEPSSWIAMILGFGLAGAAMRRRRTSVAFA